MTIAKHQIEAMLELQGSMNAKVNPDWKNAGYAWLRAAMIEGAEAAEHYGWKWWKKQDRDLEQFGIELVDIWHFMLSHLLIETGGNDAAAEVIASEVASKAQAVFFDNEGYNLAEMDTLSRLDLMIGLASAKRMSIPLFETLIADAGMSWADLYTGYVSKNVLNFFRQDHGYKAGTYIKMWPSTDGAGLLREDNVVMAEIVRSMDPELGSFASELYAKLKKAYPGSRT